MKEKRHQNKKKKKRLAKGRGSSGYPPAEGRVEHSQRNSSQENYIIFSLQTQKRETAGGANKK